SPALVFKKAGGRAAWGTACRQCDCAGPWLLVGDRSAGGRWFRWYAQRTRTEELFKDEKSSGWHWEESRVTEPAHAAWLVLLRTLATCLALAWGRG
ncbi:MAG: hypothetical protein IRY99_20360, partial [Isosphaeraceae bacterium]|nr:hypothetical protein [Isosphaeraceae bacterium]